jgi:hypothetical protein
MEACMDRVSRRDYWHCVLELQASSGLSIHAFCVQEKIPYASFFVWRRRLRDISAKPEVPASSSAESSASAAESSPKTSDRISFTPVTVVPSTPAPAPLPPAVSSLRSSALVPASTISGGIEIVLSGDRRVVLRGAVDRQALSDVLAVLGVCVCGGGAGVGTGGAAC